MCRRSKPNCKFLTVLTVSDPKTWKCLLFLTDRNESETYNLEKVYAKFLVF